jgi:hypothetical protein
METINYVIETGDLPIYRVMTARSVIQEYGFTVLTIAQGLRVVEVEPVDGRDLEEALRVASQKAGRKLELREEPAPTDTQAAEEFVVRALVELREDTNQSYEDALYRVYRRLSEKATDALTPLEFQMLGFWVNLSQPAFLHLAGIVRNRLRDQH